MESLVVACELLSWSMWDLVPDQGSNLGPLHWELRVLATGPPGKSQQFLIKESNLSFRRIPLKKKKKNSSGLIVKNRLKQARGGCKEDI